MFISLYSNSVFQVKLSVNVFEDESVRSTSGLMKVVSVLCRVLYGNKITEISKGLFEGLFSLQLL